MLYSLPDIASDTRKLINTSSKRLAGLSPVSFRRIGYTCSYVPEELILSAGMLPVRLAMPANGTCMPDPEVISGLDGFIAGCLAGEGNELPAKPQAECLFLTLEVPCANRYRSDVGAYWRYKKSLKHLRSELELLNDCGRGIRRLSQAICVSRKIRSRLMNLYTYAMRDNPPFYWRDVFALHHAGLTAPRKAFLSELDSITRSLKSTRQEDLATDTRARLIITGGCISPEEEVFDIIENASGLIAGDMLCSGSMRLQKREGIFGIIENAIDSLTEHYLYNAPCSVVKSSSPARLDRLLVLARHCRAHGLIYITSRKSEVEAADYAYLSDRLYREISVPSIKLTAEDISENPAAETAKAAEFISIIGGTV